MVIQINPINNQKSLNREIEKKVYNIFFKSLELLGGLNKLIEYKTLTWLESIVRATYVKILKEEYLKTDEEIAKIVGLTKQTVKNILKSDKEYVMKKINDFEAIKKEEKKSREHFAGGLVNWAWELLKKGDEPKIMYEYYSQKSIENVELYTLPWSIIVLEKIKGIKYPIVSKKGLKEKLDNIKIKEKNINEILDKIEFPINNPPELLHKIKEALE